SVTPPADHSWLHTLSGAAVAVAPMQLQLDTPLDRNHELGAPVMQRTSLLRIDAVDSGRWGDRLRISVEDEASGLVSGATLAAVNSVTEIVLSSPTGVEPGTLLELSGAGPTDPPIGPLLKVAGINR